VGLHRLVRLFTRFSAQVSAPAANSLEEFAGSLGFCDRNSFQRLLEHERRRSRRNNQPLNAVGLRYGAPGAAPSGAEADQSAWKRILEEVAHHLRDTDLRHFDGHEITVLLPDTNSDGASVAGQRLADLTSTCLEGVVPSAEAKKYLAFRHWLVTEVNPPARAEDSQPPTPSGSRDGRAERGSGRFDGRASPRPPTHSRSRWSGPALAKRAIDLVGASTGTVLALPVMAVIALAIKLTSPGPVLFRQPRLGHGGRVFSMLKFRTMRVDGDDQLHRDYIRSLIENGTRENRGTADQPVFKLTNDPRVIPLGCFLRRWSLDELPQLWNVIAGDMSLVGPRPSVHYEVENYRSWYFQRLEAKPGLTGLWQVHGRARTTFDDMVRMDLRYIRKWSLLLDLRLMARTFDAVLRRQGGL